MSTNFKEVKHSLTKKLIINFLIICTIAGILLTSLSYSRTRYYIWNLSSRITTSCSLSVAHMLYGAPIKDYLEHKQMESYNYYNNILKDMAKSFNLRYLYVYVPDVKNNKIIPVFGVDVKTNGPIKNFTLAEPPETLKLSPRVIEAFYSKQERLTLEMNNNYGHVLTGYSVILDKKNNPVAIVGADVEFSYLTKKLLQDSSIFFVSIFLALLLLYLLGIFYIQKTFIKPILKLTVNMKNYMRHDNNDVKTIDLTTGDEINIIADLYNDMAQEKKRILNELVIAKKIQLSSLPRIFPPFPERKEFDIYADIKTAKEVGGDFYDFFFIDSEHFVFLIADVCGKGIPAALFMMEVKSLLKNVLRTGISIDEAIFKTNKEICENNKQNLFVTLFISIINLNTGEISYVNAGHNPPLLKRADSEFEYCKMENNIVLGIMNDFKYKRVDDKLNKGDILFLYTDGVTESINEDGILYGEENLKNSLNENTNLEAEKIIEKVEKDVETYSKNAEQSDDITTLVFKYSGKE